MRKIKIISTAKYLPKKIVTAQEMADQLGIDVAWIEKKSGVLKRHFVEDETAPSMGALVAKEALKKAELKFTDIDALVAVSGTPSQPIPCNAVLIQEAMGEHLCGVPAFDINTTCLSFLTGLDIVSYMIAAGRFKRVLFVASDVASMGLNYKQKESCTLMGDSAVAILVEGCDDSEKSGIIASRMETYSAGAKWAEIRGGGTLRHPTRGKDIQEDDYYFDMQGHKIFEMASRYIKPFCDKIVDPINMKIQDFNLVIPHQASLLALKIMRSKLDLSEEQFYIYIQDHGNTVGTSIPIGIHNAIENKKIKRGDSVFLIGTGAGLSLGGMALIY